MTTADLALELDDLARRTRRLAEAAAAMPGQEAVAEEVKIAADAVWAAWDVADDAAQE